MSSIAVIGAGISGLTVANQLHSSHRIIVFEKENKPGGLIRCDRVNGCLFHICGGHVFNTKKTDVWDWFWKHFSQDDFTKANRNSVVFMDDGTKVPYPIENHMYLFPQSIQIQFIEDLLRLSRQENFVASDFESFLRHRFGDTLYQLYFRPYNEKVWRTDLKNIPLSWLEGKLPMPTVKEMLYNNMNHVKEQSFVHSSFWYEKKGGSQFIADTLAKDIDIRYDSEIKKIQYSDGKWYINSELFDKIVFCGNVIEFVDMICGIEIESYRSRIKELAYHGTTSVFCEIDSNPYSWIYQPSGEHKSHRIICTGNFSPTNNVNGKMTGTVEFTDFISKDDIIDNLSRMPLHPHYLSHFFSKYSYPIQNSSTRELIGAFKNYLQRYDCYLTGRFADWEYYNMDAAIDSALQLCCTIQ